MRRRSISRPARCAPSASAAARTLAATTGLFVAGNAVFDAGPAALNLQTPFIGDRALALTPGQDALLPSLSGLDRRGRDLRSQRRGPGTIDGTPGATVSISGQSVAISGTTVRATAGTLNIQSATTLTVSDGAVLSTPGYQKNFGDAADPYTVYAPGGLLHLTALDGDIDLEAGSLLSVGGGTGKAGTIELSAAQGNVIFDGTLDANAPGAGGSFVLDQKGAFDISDFDAMFGSQFDNTIAVRRRAAT